MTFQTPNRIPDTIAKISTWVKSGTQINLIKKFDDSWELFRDLNLSTNSNSNTVAETQRFKTKQDCWTEIDYSTTLPLKRFQIRNALKQALFSLIFHSNVLTVLDSLASWTASESLCGRWTPDVLFSLLYLWKMLLWNEGTVFPIIKNANFA